LESWRLLIEPPNALQDFSAPGIERGFLAVGGLSIGYPDEEIGEAQLIFTALAELSTRQIAETVAAVGLPANKRAAKTGGKIAQRARLELESKTGRKVVTGENYLPSSKSKKALTPYAICGRASGIRRVEQTDSFFHPTRKSEDGHPVFVVRSPCQSTNFRRVFSLDYSPSRLRTLTIIFDGSAGQG
jgi:hypothetical protein